MLLRMAQYCAPGSAAYNLIMGKLRDDLLAQVEKKHKERTMKVSYRAKDHDNKPCEREIEIPEGYYRVESRDQQPGDFSAGYDRWIELNPPKLVSVGVPVIRRKPTITLEVGAWYEVESGGIYRLSAPITRPDGCTYLLNQGWFYKRDGSPRHPSTPRITKRVYVADYNTLGDTLLAQMQREAADPKPFRLTGPGWYRTRGGSWVRNPATYSDVGCAPYDYEDDGRYLPGSPYKSGRELDIISRATDAQAKILDGL